MRPGYGLDRRITPQPNYTPMYSLRDGIQLGYDGAQTAYTAGLSYFPDYSFAAEPLGDISYADVGAVGGGAVAGPVGSAVGSVTGSLIQRWIGGSAVDQQRQSRVNYFLQQAGNGNVAAAQLILGAPSNVSGNEQQMWINAAAALKSAAPDVYAAAQAAGPVWLTNSGDTATNYPAMKNFTQTWAMAHPFTTAVGAMQGAVGGFVSPTPPSQVGGGIPISVAVTPSIPPVLLYGGLAAAAYFILRRRRS